MGAHFQMVDFVQGDLSQPAQRPVLHYNLSVVGIRAAFLALSSFPH